MSRRRPKHQKIERGKTVVRDMGTKEFPEELRTRCACGGIVDTRLALTVTANEDGSKKWTGVPCDKCNDLYTFSTERAHG